MWVILGKLYLHWSCSKRTPSPSEDTKATRPLEMLMPVIIQECHSKSTLNKPFLRQHKNLLQSALTIFSERQALFPQCALGNICMQTSWPHKGRFRAPVKTSGLFVLRCSGSLKGSHAPCSQNLPVPDLKDNNYAHTNISRRVDMVIILWGAITIIYITFHFWLSICYFAL